MHYTKSNLPKWVKAKLPEKARAIWMSEWNNAFKQYKSEEKSFKIAITAVKKAGYKKVEEKYSKTGEDNMKKETKPKKVSCECIKCGHKISTSKHCKDIKCPECGGTMRRKNRPGPGQDGGKMEKIKDESELILEEPKVDIPEDNMKNGEFVIQINGVIGEEITIDSVNAQLEKAEGQDVVIEVASPGGSVFEGVEIFNAIRNYEGKTEARIIGMAASMASYIPLATDKVLAEDNATFMIHNAWGMVIGDSEKMKEEAEILESINGLLAQEYVNKTGKSEKEVLQLMSDETWLFGSEIKDEGFIDEIITHKDNLKENKPKKDKESAFIEAKDKFKSTLSRIKENRMKLDLEKMKNRLSLKGSGVNKMKKMSKFVMWSNEYKNALPDSAFAVVIGEGDKKVRKLPYKDANGKVDIPHLRNALVRVAQSGINLSPSQRTSALGKLKSVANKYLETNKETKSGEVMLTAISKFEVNVKDKLSAIIKTLKSKATNLKPEDDVSFSVKSIGLLIQDLEEITEYEKTKEKTAEEEAAEEKGEEKEEEKKEEEKAEETEEKKEEKTEEKKETEETKEEKEDEKETKEEETKETEEKKEEESGKEEEKKEETEKKDGEEEEEESKFKELLKVCEGFQKENKLKEELVSKFQKENKELQKQIDKLNESVSKFKEDSFGKLLNNTVEKVSKFKNLNSTDTLDLKKHYLESKMSESALEEIGRTTEEQMMSKLQEPKVTTKPTEMLEPAEDEKQEFSKMSKEDQLDVLAQANAKVRGFVSEE